MFIRTERLFLRPAWPEDAAELANLLDEGGDEVMSNIASSELPIDPISDLGRGVSPGLLITMPSNNGPALIGGIMLTSDDGKLRLGYWLSRSHRGKGFAAEAARGMLALARAFGHARVFASKSLDDRASLLVLTRTGFRPIGDQRAGHAGMAAAYVADLRSDRHDGSDADEVRAA